MSIVSPVKHIIFFTLILIGACQTMDDGYFSELANSGEVVIVLDDYELDEVPPEIELLSKATDLRIVQDRGWQVYPPISFYPPLAKFPPPYRFLPDEITTLTQLQDLSISGLNLAELPQNFSQLKNLESLDLTHNKLNISAEWGKLKSLPKLREVTVIGNVVDTAEVHRWMDERPGLKVIYHWNDIKEEW